MVHLPDAGRDVRPAEAGRTAARSLCNLSLRTASGPEGSSAKQILTCAAGYPGRGRTPHLNAQCSMFNAQRSCSARAGIQYCAFNIEH